MSIILPQEDGPLLNEDSQLAQNEKQSEMHSAPSVDSLVKYKSTGGNSVDKGHEDETDQLIQQVVESPIPSAIISAPDNNVRERRNSRFAVTRVVSPSNLPEGKSFDEDISETSYIVQNDEVLLANDFENNSLASPADADSGLKSTSSVAIKVIPDKVSQK